MANTEMNSRLAFADFTDAQRKSLADVQARIATLVPPALDRFYAMAARTPETARQFRDASHMAHAKEAQMRHWQHIASARFDDDYYNSVRRIGERHAKIGLEPRWYIGAYMLVLENLVRGLMGGGLLGKRNADTVVAVVKAALLDMELSVSIYFERSEAAQKQVVGALEQGLSQLAAGDLTGFIEEEFEPGYESVRTNFNGALTSLRELIGTVADSSASIRGSSTEIAQASEDLARRTEGNAASLEQTTATIVQMNGRLKAGAEAARGTVDRADGAMRTVAAGRATADDAVQAMGRVSESAKGIDSVIEGLDKIAFQTRVLAMNAAVEAGRAGEAGRGFAVVADLVSALAMRAEEEAGRARDQLTATQSDIVAAVEMVQRVDGVFAEISDDVGAVHSQLSHMAGENAAQSGSVAEITSTIAAMDQATQQNAAMVEQASAAARNLSVEITSLASQAARFRVSRDAPSARSTAPTPARPRPAPVTASNYVSPVKALPAAAVANHGGNNDWTSF